MTIQQ